MLCESHLTFFKIHSHVMSTDVEKHLIKLTPIYDFLKRIFVVT